MSNDGLAKNDLLQKRAWIWILEERVLPLDWRGREEGRGQKW